jgi:hypothetical protein
VPAPGLKTNYPASVTACQYGIDPEHQRSWRSDLDLVLVAASIPVQCEAEALGFTPETSYQWM